MTDLSGTTIAVWQERDRLHICLSRKADDATLIEWWDEDAREAIDDGFLDGAISLRGALQGGALHKSAFEYWATCNVRKDTE